MTNQMTMSERIIADVGEKNKASIFELYLDNCASTDTKELTDEFVGLEVLSLINCQITNLDFLPTLPNLKILDCSTNSLSDDLKKISSFANLSHLNLCGNKIADVQTLKPLAVITPLKSLDISDNDVVDYREEVFKLLPQLDFLDGVNAAGEEMDVDKADGAEDGGEEDGAETDGDSDEEANDETTEEDDEDGEHSPGISMLNDSAACEAADNDPEDFIPQDGQDAAGDAPRRRGTKRKADDTNDRDDVKR
uniref:LRRcap domain-containing protein n=1 Tax=Rhabditophanes sp. KR3021 TaxID=114890 RepID=A0AC35U3L7_9BILA